MSQAFINNQSYDIKQGETIYQFVSRHFNKNEIPVLCHDESLEPFGSCRMCSVEVAGDKNSQRRIMASCHALVESGQYIYTNSPVIKKLRSTLMELLLSDYPDNRLTPCGDEKPTPFQQLIPQFNIKDNRFPLSKSKRQPDTSHPYIHFDATQCIHCFRCVRACDEVQGEMVLAMRGRGYDSDIIFSMDQLVIDSECVACGQCVQTCPTNALTDRYHTKTLDEDQRTRTVCTYCGVGCNFDVLIKNKKIVAMMPVNDSEVNQGHACLKGRYAFEYYNHPDRLTTPLIRKDNKLEPASWDEAMDYIAEMLNTVLQRSGPQSVAGISSSRCTNEENYLMQKFMRVVIGNNNIDGCARVCHAPTAFGMRQVLGTGAATNSIDQIPLADCLLVVGANVTQAHPVTGAKIRQQAMKGVPLIVIDPRRIELTRYATHHLQLRPGTNVALLDMFIYYLINEQLIDEEFVTQRTEGFEDFKRAAINIDLDRLEKITGVDRQQVCAAAVAYGQATNAMCFHGLGLTEHYQGSRGVMLVASIAMMTGNIGRPGVGVNPLRGQNNVQGAADMGVQPKLGAGYLDVSDEKVRQHYEKYYGRPVPSEQGLTTPEMIHAAAEGKLKALWIMGEDILQTDPDTTHVRSALKTLDFLVVQEIFMTETASMANVVLPAASHLEKSGTFTNGERRIQKVNKVTEPLAGTKADGQIIVDIMNRMGYEQEGYDPVLHLDEISKVVPFFAGVSWDSLGDNGKQWPVAEDGTDTKTLHADQFKRGRGRFVFTDFIETPELLADDLKDYPFILTTGRRLQHYNCGSMTRRTPNIDIINKDVLLINPEDAKSYGIHDDDQVEIRSRQGVTHLSAQLSEEVKAGVLFTTFHFPEVAINQLTSGVLDLDANTPEFKVTAVAISKTG
ncbi:MAG: formate dehydrogenase subunit alpha [Gammaproteobacteria bacterium]|nr:formate dehydrogenase subunit alpha [Gammaproteobacteria bacterium]